ncbi:L-allo-threonine aldolase [Castellaniella defragrans]
MTDAMRKAMLSAVVGDDVLGEDPSVNQLEEKSARLFGKEAGLLVASGTMGNQVAMMALSVPGDKIVVFAPSHMYNLECGGLAALSGVQVRPIQPTGAGARLDELEAAIRPRGVQYAHTGVLCLENTLDLNRGIPVSPETQQAMADVAHRHGAKVYLDGARIFNAAAALGRPLADFGRSVDCLQFCLNKGLSAPVGAVLVGDRAFIDRARRIRQRVGGAIRHIGYMAAAGIVALDEMIPRIAEDHENAARLREGLRAVDERLIDPDEGLFTNIIRLNVAATGRSTDQVTDAMLKSGIRIKRVDASICRMVTHSGTRAEDVDAALAAARAVFD